VTDFYVDRAGSEARDKRLEHSAGEIVFLTAVLKSYVLIVLILWSWECTVR
jgi:hypothetical protein